MPSLKSLTRRQRVAEVMDQPGLDPGEHTLALAGLRRINAVSRCSASLFTPIRELAARHQGTPLRVLDLACGGGDTAIDLALMARRSAIPLILEGCDISPGAVAIARANAERRGAKARFFRADALTDPLPSGPDGAAPGGYDVVLTSLFLHHLDDHDAEMLLALMGRRARQLVLVNDLIRSPLGYGLAWAGTRLLSRSWIVHTDGPRSVQGAFQLAEVAAMAERAGLQGATLQRCWPERYLLSWSRG
ncbi:MULTISPECIES: methyltransferase domain-containing protein [unclassified Synechococcus]|uniref:methyltransferase domain-containing protein n=1 Tax=unclassified Synechococcus TaxID=2626047 RepID=UPI0005672A95|nr:MULTISPECIES: methyltransferase domain-containing protein [unclassified Synechococcus]WFN59384.1 methyltransferase domain-containing protein [Synechococcus sp. CCFWC 502]